MNDPYGITPSDPDYKDLEQKYRIVTAKCERLEQELDSLRGYISRLENIIVLGNTK